MEDLQAQLLTSRLEEGRTLVTATNNNSLAAEFEAMTSEEVSHIMIYYYNCYVCVKKQSFSVQKEAMQNGCFL